MTELTKYDPKSGYSLTQWGLMEDLSALGARLKQVLPGGKDLSPWEAVGLAQYAHQTGANPFRGEVYGYSDKHGFHIVEGYKLLVRWAQDRAPYTEHYTPLDEGLAQGDIGYTCHILKRVDLETLSTLCKAGLEATDALEMVTTTAGGVVRAGEMGKQPPNGWTWHDVARKRALKNALNRSHGAPSPDELHQASMTVNGTETQPRDWEGTAEMSQEEREAQAEYNAKARARAEVHDDVTAPDAIAELYGDPELESDYPDGEGLPLPPHWIDRVDPNGTPVRTRFWAWATGDNENSLGLAEAEVYEALGVEHIHDYDGSMEDARARITAWVAQQIESAEEAQT